MISEVVLSQTSDPTSTQEIKAFPVFPKDEAHKTCPTREDLKKFSRELALYGYDQLERRHQEAFATDEWIVLGSLVDYGKSQQPEINPNENLTVLENKLDDIISILNQPTNGTSRSPAEIRTRFLAKYKLCVRIVLRLEKDPQVDPQELKLSEIKLGIPPTLLDSGGIIPLETSDGRIFGFVRPETFELVIQKNGFPHVGRPEITMDGNDFSESLRKSLIPQFENKKPIKLTNEKLQEVLGIIITKKLYEPTYEEAYAKSRYKQHLD